METDMTQELFDEISLIHLTSDNSEEDLYNEHMIAWCFFMLRPHHFPPPRLVK